MIDNLQIHYLQQLELALKMALHGQLEAAIDMCFELRVKPDLALYTRAEVNLTLADLTTMEKHPDKLKFAQEGQRLADELLNHNDQENNAYWIQKYTNLASRAAETVRSVEAEKEKFEKESKDKAQDKEVQDLRERLKATVEEYAGRDQNEDIVVDMGDGWFAVDPHKVTTNQLPPIEGIFSTKLETRDNANSLPDMPERLAAKKEQSE